MRTPRYIQRLRASNKGYSEFDIERSILQKWKREWSQNRRCPGHPSGKTWAFHFLRYLEILYPRQDIHPWIRRQVKAIEVAYWVEGRKLINIIGSQSSSKTDFAASFTLAMLTIDPEFTNAFAATPYLNAAQSTLWGRMQARFNAMKKPVKDEYFPTAKLNADKVVIQDLPNSGSVTLRTFDKVSSLQGTKQPDPHGQRGALLVICDEVALFKNSALKDALDNILSNSRVIILTGCNFKDIEGLEGELCQPEGRDYQDLDIEKDQYWRSAYHGFTLRLDGHRSPNIRSGRVKYPYLFREERRADMEKQHGLEGPKYLEQCRSFPSVGNVGGTIVTRSDFNVGGVFDTDLVWVPGVRERLASCDPGFGGDPCVIQAFEFRVCKVFTASGDQVQKMVFMPIGMPEVIRLRNNMAWDDAWGKRFHAAMQGKPYHRPIANGVTYEQQIAVGVHEFLVRHDISRKNLIFDGSMRAAIVQEMDSIIGTEAVALDPNSQPTERTCSTRGEIARDVYDRFASELLFAVGETVRAGQMRGGEYLNAAITQLCRRSWKHKGDKRAAEKKDDYIKRAGSSPNDADVLTYALELARRRGFVVFPDKKPATGNLGTRQSLTDLRGMAMNIVKRVRKLSA